MMAKKFQLYLNNQYSNKKFEKETLISDKPFKPSSPPKVGYNKTINSFPKYSEQGYRQCPIRKPKTEGEDTAKKLWRMTHNNNISHVISPIASNYINLKSEFKTMLK